MSGSTLDARIGDKGRKAEELSSAVLLDVSHHVADGLQFLRFLVRDFDGEFLLKRHDQFHSIQGVGTKVLDEFGIQHDLLGIHAELVDDDIFDFLFDGFFGHKIFR